MVFFNFEIEGWKMKRNYAKIANSYLKLVKIHKRQPCRHVGDKRIYIIQEILANTGEDMSKPSVNCFTPRGPHLTVHTTG
jgi:hypothetical protein